MSLKSKYTALQRSIYFRLAVMYAVICTASLIVVLLASYLVLENTLQKSLDSDLKSEIGEYAALLESQDITVLRDVLDHEAVSEGTDSIFFRVLTTSGDIVLETDMRTWQKVPAPPACLEAAAAGQSIFDSIPDPARGAPIRIVYGPIAPDLILQIGESTLGDIQTLHRLRQVFFLGILGFICCSCLMGIVMARRALSGVRRVTMAAHTISAGGWDSRVAISRRNDEIDELAMAFNEMIDRIQILIRELKEVTDDIAHDLRTPITRMRIIAEAELAHVDLKKNPENMPGQILEECDHLLELINTMLEISQINASTRPLAQTSLDLTPLVDDICDLFRTAAEDKEIRFDFQAKEALFIRGEAKKLKRAIAHIIDNAIKYTPPEGKIDVRAFREKDTATITVADTGVGIPEADLEKVFARFYRVDKSRTENGNGLGLSLSRAILKAHGGTLSVSSDLGKGSTFTLTLPIRNS